MNGGEGGLASAVEAVLDPFDVWVSCGGIDGRDGKGVARGWEGKAEGS